jgi:ABC-type transport system involved in cytochrome bd biosynthesis fused ATPase/permease subunit
VSSGLRIRTKTARVLLAGAAVPLVVVAASVLAQRLMLPFAVLSLQNRTHAVAALLAAAALGFVRTRAADVVARRLRLNLLDLFLAPFVSGPAPSLPAGEAVTARLAADLPRLVTWANDGVALVLAAALAIPAVVVLLASALGVRVLLPIAIAGVVGAATTTLASRHVSAAWTAAVDRLRALFISVGAGYEGAVDLRAHGRAGSYAARLREQMSTWSVYEGRARVATTVSTWGSFAVTLATAAAIIALSSGTFEPGVDPYRLSLLVLAAVPTLHTLVSGISNLLAARSTLASTARQLALAEAATLVESDAPIDSAGEIRLERIGYSYPRGEDGSAPVAALDGLDLALPARGSVAITGPNGAGKTTLAHVLLGVVRPDRGRILVADREATLDNRRFRSRIAYLSQRPFQVAEGTIADNLRAFDPELPDGRLLEALVVVGLRDSLGARAKSDADLLALPYRALSRGQSRRVMLARALLRDTDLLVLDEPEAHLDAASTTELAAILKRIASARRVVAVVHDRELLGFADQVVELTPPAKPGS